MTDERRQAAKRANGTGRGPGSGVFPRFLLYSHDSWGLGHLRRSLTLAKALVDAHEGANALVVTGSPCATHFAHPAGVSIVKLPSVTKNESGEYQPRSLGSDLSSVLALRSGLLREAFRSFSPHLVLVDHQVIGLHGEALPMLQEARSRGAKTVFGIRDIIDSPSVVERQWSSPPCQWALESVYDRICSYGDERIFDPRLEYGSLSRIADRVEMTGYVVREESAVGRRERRARPEVLVTMGGGQDGVERVRTYLDCLSLGPVEWKSTIVTGPLMTEDEVRAIRSRARRLGSVRVHRFHPDLPHLLTRADVVVAMAGYNSSAEILRSGTPAIFLPRTFPRREQAIRAVRLARRGLGQVLLSLDPSLLRRRIDEVLRARPVAGDPPRLDGAARVCQIAGDLLGIDTNGSARRLSEWRHASHTC